MADKDQLRLFYRGTEAWNKWRENNPTVKIDLSSIHFQRDDLHTTNLRHVNLRYVNLSHTNFSNIDLRNADFQKADLTNAIFRNTDLSNADLRGVTLTKADLTGANLNFADLSKADLRDALLHKSKFHKARFRSAVLTAVNLSSADLSNIDLRNADLQKTNLANVSLRNADLRNANLREAILYNANLRGADFSGADLSGANMAASQVLDTTFDGATLTGACIANWQVGSSTKLNGVSCDYVFRIFDSDLQKFTSRLPTNEQTLFAASEFEHWVRVRESALETIDLTFTEGIDWQAFFQSFQQLRHNRPDEDISIQGMERKGDAFVVRLEVDAEADKASIETEVKQRYDQQIAVLETRYQEQLRLQSEEIAHYRQTQSSFLHIVQTMAEKDSISQTFHGSVGNVAGTNHGSMTAYINQNNEAISQLIAALKSCAQTFPTEQKEEVLMELDDLEADLNKPEKQEPKRIGKRLQRLIAAGTAAATFATGAATFSSDINKFTGNVLDLADKIGLSRDEIQLNQEAP
jgi:uncharacterized protein YjbI with pentapeptide repeats